LSDCRTRGAFIEAKKDTKDWAKRQIVQRGEPGNLWERREMEVDGRAEKQ